MKNKLIKVKQFIIKNLLGMIIGGVIVGSITIASANYAFDGSNVYYDKSNSGGSYSNVQDSITELYDKIGNGKKVEEIKKMWVEPDQWCNKFTYGKWVSLTKSGEDTYCAFEAQLDKDYGPHAVCNGDLYGNYSDYGTNGDQFPASFRWGSGAPYAGSLSMGGLGEGGALLTNGTNNNTMTELYYFCEIYNKKLIVGIRATKNATTTWSYVSYGWQTRADGFYFDGYIIY